ncbi:MULTISPECIES: helix-turn-helix domain-containing protein [Roseateles]|uniref:Transcriptional regulator n=1 Tax=Pelomonas caseinilytica TaxID=2906763 RepID=A0ABS8XF07_9BURK|nr:MULTISPECIES: transcriptional regulator [unclassified Roseateles]MCE4538358.1 transcriptional regulator [Pelomonas sp. P7]HEV6964764.1 transcriptional regulator [Roseateles sp.]
MLRELLETAEDLNGYGVMSKTNMAKVRALCAEPPVYTPDRVVSVRTTIAKMSQAVFASFLNVSVSTVQKWESPSADKHPSGAAAKLLQLVESKGVEALIA